MNFQNKNGLFVCLNPFACVAAAVLLAACNGGSDKSTAAASSANAPVSQAKAEGEHKGVDLKLSAEEAQRAGIKVEALAKQAVGGSVTVTATIHANQDRIARVAPRVEGRILRVSGNLGDTVKQGQVLAVLDSIAIGEAQSALLQAQSAQRVAQAASPVPSRSAPTRSFPSASSSASKRSWRSLLPRRAPPATSCDCWAVVRRRDGPARPSR